MIKFTVYGTPKPQGSMKAFHRPGMRYAVVTSDNAKLKPWRQEITGAAMMLPNVPTVQFEGAQDVKLRFYFAKPASAKKRTDVTVKPDVDKLARAVLDGLTGVMWRDDSQVVKLSAEKFYGLPERVEIEVAGVS